MQDNRKQGGGWTLLFTLIGILACCVESHRAGVREGMREAEDLACSQCIALKENRKQEGGGFYVPPEFVEELAQNRRDNPPKDLCELLAEAFACMDTRKREEEKE